MGAIRSECSQTTQARIETAQHNASAKIGVAQYQSEADTIESVEATKRANI